MIEIVGLAAAAGLVLVCRSTDVNAEKIAVCSRRYIPPEWRPLRDNEGCPQ